MASKIGDILHKGVVLGLVATTGFFASQVGYSLYATRQRRLDFEANNDVPMLYAQKLANDAAMKLALAPAIDKDGLLPYQRELMAKAKDKSAKVALSPMEELALEQARRERLKEVRKQANKE
jgi:hypothetical protein